MLLADRCIARLNQAAVALFVVRDSLQESKRHRLSCHNKKVILEISVHECIKTKKFVLNFNVANY